METRGGNTWNPNGDRSGWILRTEWKHKTFPRLFFDGCDGIAGRSRSELPGFSPLLFAIHRFDTVGRYVGYDVTRGQEVTQWRWPTRTYRFFHRPRDIFPSLWLPLPSRYSSSQFYFLSAATRFLPILIKRISRHQFRVPWSPRDINYGRNIPAIHELWMVRLNIVDTIVETVVAFLFLSLSLF